MKKSNLIISTFITLNLIVSCSLFLEDDNRQLYADDYATVLGDSVSHVLFFSDAGYVFQDTLYKDSVHFIGKRIRFEYKILNTKNNITFIQIKPNYVLLSQVRLESKPYQTDTSIIHSLQNVNFTPKYGAKGEFYLNVHGVTLTDTLSSQWIHVIAEDQKFTFYYNVPTLSEDFYMRSQIRLQPLNFSCDLGKLDRERQYFFRYRQQLTNDWVEKEIVFIQEEQK